MARSVLASPEVAHRHYVQGLAHVEASELDAARTEFEAAYRESPHYAVLYNLGRVCFELGDHAAAQDYLRRFLDEGGSRIPDEQRREANELLASLAVAPPRSSDPEPLESQPLEHPALLKQIAPAPGALSQEKPRLLSVSALDKEKPSRSAMALGAGGLALLAGAGVLAVWNHARYTDWKDANAQLLANRPPLEVATEEDLARLGSYQRAVGRSRGQLESIETFDAVSLTAAAIGAVLVGVGVVLHATTDTSPVHVGARDVKLDCKF